MSAEAAAAPALEASRLTKAYRGDGAEVAAVRDVDLRVDGGEFVAVMGPSGCGKSTLVHLLGGLARPTAGRVFIEGTDLATRSDRQLAEIRRTKVGFVFQAFNLVPVLSAIENVALPAVIAGRDREWARQRAADLMAAVGLSARHPQRPGQLSGGEQQRVAIARALVMEPAVVFADEPTGNLDSGTGRDIVRLLLDLNASGQTVVLVTHDVKVAGVAHRLLLMRDGHLRAASLATDGIPGGPSPATDDAIHRLLDVDDPADQTW